MRGGTLKLFQKDRIVTGLVEKAKLLKDSDAKLWV